MRVNEKITEHEETTIETTQNEISRKKKTQGKEGGREREIERK